jgi:endonuclease YncB( thermonuclease family)
MRAFIAALACCLPIAATAARYQAVVSHVTDGDTVWVRPANGGPPQQIRIDGIDAPEICQPYGGQARDALASHLLQRRVTVITRGADNFQRTMARIQLGHQDTGAWMVSRGHAWSYRFRSDPGPYAREEARARARRAGLWGMGSPEPPRNFRVRNGPCH